MVLGSIHQPFCAADFFFAHFHLEREAEEKPFLSVVLLFPPLELECMSTMFRGMKFDDWPHYDSTPETCSHGATFEFEAINGPALIEAM